ncbi:hypothetical protein Dda_0167 [Drechslerella dactyloides]|uniref:Uncharacterized protein n=1 Tax=Drechslerella dactyloides TaxID=74499 RepID=A0AAD6J3U9_DREDA|nr:hypothetical protein Dda_0167 [Drechslerella dactyloides]
MYYVVPHVTGILSCSEVRIIATYLMTRSAVFNAWLTVHLEWNSGYQRVYLPADSLLVVLQVRNLGRLQASNIKVPGPKKWKKRRRTPTKRLVENACMERSTANYIGFQLKTFQMAYFARFWEDPWNNLS